jgi:hypothetical protein
MIILYFKGARYELLRMFFRSYDVNLPFWWMRIIAMAVFTSDFSITVVNDEFGMLK